MKKLAMRAVGLGALVALLGAGSYAIAGDGTRNFSGREMSGYEENPDVSSVAKGSFDARLSKDGETLSYELSYSGLEGAVTQAHIHFGKRAVNGGISLWLCQSATNVAPTAGIPVCPQEGQASGELTRDDVVGPTGQGIAPREWEEILAAMRAGHAYANVHTSKFPGGEIRAQLNDSSGDVG